MKMQFGVYVSVSTVEKVRERAAATGAPIGDLADLLMRYGLERVSDEALRKWVEAKASTRGRLAGGPTQNERRALTALATLVAASDGAWRFSHGEIATKAGLRPTDAYNALQALQARGLVVGVADPSSGLDRWERPVKSYWHRVDSL